MAMYSASLAPLVAMTWPQVKGTPVISAVRSATSFRNAGSPLTVV